MSALHKVPSLCHSLRQPNWNQTLYVHYASISKVLKNPPLTWAVKLGLRPLSATRAGVRAHSSLSVAPGALLSFTIGWGACCQRAPACTLLCVETLPGSSVHRILQARTLEWVAVSFCRASSRPRDLARVSRTAGGFSTLWAPRGAPQLPACSPSRAAVFPPCDQAPHVVAVETPHLAWPAHSLSTVSPGDQSPRLCSPTADQPSLWLCRPLQRAHPLCLLFYCLFSFVNLIPMCSLLPHLWVREHAATWSWSGMQDPRTQSGPEADLSPQGRPRRRWRLLLPFQPPRPGPVTQVLQFDLHFQLLKSSLCKHNSAGTPLGLGIERLRQKR